MVFYKSHLLLCTSVKFLLNNFALSPTEKAKGALHYSVFKIDFFWPEGHFLDPDFNPNFIGKPFFIISNLNLQYFRSFIPYFLNEIFSGNWKKLRFIVTMLSWKSLNKHVFVAFLAKFVHFLGFMQNLSRQFDLSSRLSKNYLFTFLLKVWNLAKNFNTLVFHITNMGFVYIFWVNSFSLPWRLIIDFRKHFSSTVALKATLRRICIMKYALTRNWWPLTVSLL